jgi:hypothetical protein
VAILVTLEPLVGIIAFTKGEGIQCFTKSEAEGDEEAIGWSEDSM